LKTKKIANQISEEHKNIDILINCAGIGIYKPLEDLTLEDWNRSMNICTKSSFLFMKNLLKNISNSDNSLILNIGSGAGAIPMAGRSAYCAAKFALRGITLSLAEEYKRIGKPKFCLITLGSTLTSFGPLSFEEKKLEMEKGKAYFTPEWVAEKLTEIIKDENREMEYVLYPGDYGFGEWEVPEPK
jgi:short-subunit dehydrogenase